MASRYISSLNDDEYKKLTQKLHEIQAGSCFICQKAIDLAIHETNIDHIVPLAAKGKDAEENFALAHDACNKSKQDANLRIARVLHRLKDIQETVQAEEGRSASLKDVLAAFGGAKYAFKYRIEEDRLIYSFGDIGDTDIRSTAVIDKISNEKTCFLNVPLAYIHHDSIINPRGINSSISLLVKEFYKGNPQLHLTLARMNDGQIQVFDGQHKAVAQIILGNMELLLRVFISPVLNRLTETNTNAGSTLRQIAFDKSIMRQLNNTLYYERIRKYQTDHGHSEDTFDFSESQLVEYFKGENVNIKKYIIDSLKHSITYSKENHLKDFIDFEGKAKELPISYSAFEKTFLTTFIDPKLILSTNISYKTDEGANPRELEITQLVKLMNIVANVIYINKFDPAVGVARIEQRIIDKKDAEITDDHLVAYRVSKEEILYNWLQYLKKVIESYFANIGKLFDSNRLFQQPFPEQLWKNIENFIKSLILLPLWKDRGKASTLFSGKNTYDFWRTVFDVARTPDGVLVLAKPLNYIEMIKNDE